MFLHDVFIVDILLFVSTGPAVAQLITSEVQYDSNPPYTTFNAAQLLDSQYKNVNSAQLPMLTPLQQQDALSSAQLRMLPQLQQQQPLGQQWPVPINQPFAPLQLQPTPDLRGLAQVQQQMSTLRQELVQVAGKTAALNRLIGSASRNHVGGPYTANMAGATYNGNSDNRAINRDIALPAVSAVGSTHARSSHPRGLVKLTIFFIACAAFVCALIYIGHRCRSLKHRLHQERAASRSHKEQKQQLTSAPLLPVAAGPSKPGLAWYRCPVQTQKTAQVGQGYGAAWVDEEDGRERP